MRNKYIFTEEHTEQNRQYANAATPADLIKAEQQDAERAVLILNFTNLIHDTRIKRFFKDINRQKILDAVRGERYKDIDNIMKEFYDSAAEADEILKDYNKQFEELEKEIDKSAFSVPKIM